jgi:hypothetical protein
MQITPKFEWKRDEKTLVKSCRVEEFELETVSAFSPESYDVYRDGFDKIAYISLSRGLLTVKMGKRQIYSAMPNGYGQFEDTEREFYLSLCLGAIRLEYEKCMKM